MKERDDYYFEHKLESHAKSQLEINMELSKGGTFNVNELNEINDYSSVRNYATPNYKSRNGKPGLDG